MKLTQTRVHFVQELHPSASFCVSNDLYNSSSAYPRSIICRWLGSEKFPYWWSNILYQSLEWIAIEVSHYEKDKTLFQKILGSNLELTRRFSMEIHNRTKSTETNREIDIVTTVSIAQVRGLSFTRPG